MGVSAFFTFLLIAANTVINVSVNNNNNNNNDNNININNFMEMGPGKRELLEPSLSFQTLFDLLQSANQQTLERVETILQDEPDCEDIVLCDLLSLINNQYLLEIFSSWRPFTRCNNSLR